jgi:hypothetical protein
MFVVHFKVFSCSKPCYFVLPNKGLENILRRIVSIFNCIAPEDFIMENLPFVSTFTVDMMNYHITLKFDGYPGTSC